MGTVELPSDVLAAICLKIDLPVDPDQWASSGKLNGGGWSGALYRLFGAQFGDTSGPLPDRTWSEHLPAVIQLLVERGAEINHLDGWNNTPLMWAACCPDGEDGGGYAPAVRKLLSLQEQDLSADWEGGGTAAQLADQYCSSSEIKSLMKDLPNRPAPFATRVIIVS